MCRYRVGLENPLFCLWRALWCPTATASPKKAVGRQRNLELNLYLHKLATVHVGNSFACFPAITEILLKMALNTINQSVSLLRMANYLLPFLFEIIVNVENLENPLTYNREKNRHKISNKTPIQLNSQSKINSIDICRVNR